MTSAADIIKDNNSDDLNVTSSWVGGIVPTSSDLAVWNNVVTGANSTITGSALSFGGIRIASPGGAVSIDSTGNSLTLGRFGIDMSAATQDLTINGPVTISGAAGVYDWTVASGRTLTLAASPTKIGQPNNNAGIVRFSTTGAIKLGAAAQILLRDNQNNPYATYGNNDWAATDATGQVVAATYTDASTAFTAAANNNITGDFTNGSTAIDVASLRFDDATARTVIVSGSATFRTLTARGILVTENSGGATIGGNAASSFIRPNRVTVANTAFPIIQNSASDLTIGANISNGSSGAATQLVKHGAGKLILTNNNGYSGGTTIVAGAIQVGDGGTTGALGGGTVNNNGALIFNRSNDQTVANNITGAGGITFSGSGATTLSGANTYTGASNINAGTLNFNAATDLGSSGAINFGGGTLKYGAGHTTDISGRTVTINAGGASIDTNGNNVVFANPIGNGGAGALTKAGAGSLTLTGAQTYTGATNITAGTLNLAGSVTGDASVSAGASLTGAATVNGALAVGGNIAPGAAGVGTIAASALTLDSGSALTFEFGGGNDMIASSSALTINGGDLTLYQTGTTNPFASAGTFDLLTYNGAIGGSGISALAVANPQPGFSYAFADTGSIVRLQIAAVGVVAQWITDGGGSWGTADNWSTNPAIPNTAGATANFTTALTADATVTLDGNRTIGGAAFNSATGNYTIAQGAGGSLIIDNNDSNAQFSNVNGDHTISAPVVLNSSLVVEPLAGSSLAITGVLSGAGGIINADPGTLVLGNASNSFAGGVTITDGAVEFNNLGSLGAGNVSFNGGTLRYAAGTNPDVSARINPLASAPAIIDTNGNDVAFATGISGTSGFTKTGAGTLTFTVANSYTGSTTAAGGTLSVSANDQLGDAGTGAAINLAGGAIATTATMAFDNAGASARPISTATVGGTLNVADTTTLTVLGDVTGAGALTKSGLGQLRLNSLNNNSPITITAGTVLGTGNSSGTAFNNVGLGASLITFKGGALSSTTGSNATWAFDNLVAVPLATDTGDITTPNRIRWNGAVTGAGTLDWHVNSAVARTDLQNNWAGFIGTLNVDGTGNVRMAMQSLSAGQPTFNGAGWAGTHLNLEGSVVLQPTTNSGGNTISIGALSGASATATLGGGTAGSPNWTIGARNESTSFAGAIAGNSIVTKTGSGTLTLSGALTYTGATNANNGTLALPQSLTTSSAVNVSGTGAVELTASPSGNNTIRTATVSATGRGKIDLQNNKAIVTASTLPEVSALVASGRTGGSWNGAGIITSRTDADNLVTGIAVVQNSDLPLPFNDFGDQSGLSGTDVLLMYTYVGDRDLDADIDGDDFAAIDAGYSSNGALTGYINGDFDYSGTIDADDYWLIDRNYTKQASVTLTPGPIVEGVTAVPEPSAGAIVALAGAALLRRRRRA